MKKSPTVRIGGHVSAAGGLKNAIENAERIGATCIQIFGASPRQWAAKVPDTKNVDSYREALQKSNVKAVYLHGAYVVNLASPEKTTREKSITNLSTHLAIVEAIGADGLIFHVGSGKEMPKKDAMKEAVACMKQVLKNVPGKARLVIENAAGGGQKLGASPKDIGDMMRAVGSARVKVCVDTAHAFEAGLIDEYTPEKTKQFLKQWDDAVGLENIVALHVNDSKSPYDSHYDRHENIGKGFIGLKGFQVLAKQKALHDKAWLLEVPGFDNMGPDKKNIEILKGCF